MPKVLRNGKTYVVPVAPARESAAGRGTRGGRGGRGGGRGGRGSGRIVVRTEAIPYGPEVADVYHGYAAGAGHGRMIEEPESPEPAYVDLTGDYSSRGTSEDSNSRYGDAQEQLYNVYEPHRNGTREVLIPWGEEEDEQTRVHLSNQIIEAGRRINEQEQLLREATQEAHRGLRARPSPPQLVNIFEYANVVDMPPVPEVQQWERDQDGLLQRVYPAPQNRSHNGNYNGGAGGRTGQYSSNANNSHAGNSNSNYNDDRPNACWKPQLQPQQWRRWQRRRRRRRRRRRWQWR